MGLYTHVYAVFLCNRKLCSYYTKNALRKTNCANRKIPGGYFGENVVIYVRMRTE